MASDAASCDFQIAGDSRGAKSVERQSKDFRSARCKFYGVLGIVHHLPYTTHDFYCGMHGKLLADMRKMQVYELA